MNKYEKQDNIGREIFKGYCKRKQWCKFNKESKDKYAHWDVSYLSGNTMVIGEIKEREYPSSAFSDWYGEVYKYNKLHELKDKMEAKGMNVIIHYINLFNDNQIIIWDITDRPVDSFKILMPSTTVEDNGKKEKSMYRLFKAESKIWDNIKIEPIEINEDEEDDELPF